MQIAAAKTLAAGGEVPDRTIQSEGRWKDGSSTFMIYSGGNTKDSKLLPSIFARIEEREVVNNETCSCTGPVFRQLSGDGTTIEKISYRWLIGTHAGRSTGRQRKEKLRA